MRYLLTRRSPLGKLDNGGKHSRSLYSVPDVLMWSAYCTHCYDIMAIGFAFVTLGCSELNPFGSKIFTEQHCYFGVKKPLVSQKAVYRQWLLLLTQQIRSNRLAYVTSELTNILLTYSHRVAGLSSWDVDTTAIHLINTANDLP